MSTAVTWNGLTYNVPGTGDQNWSGTTGVDGLLISLANNGFQKTGGLFSLSADVDFGPTNGPVTTYFKSRTANIAQSGVFRLANGDAISFRNAANNADLALTVNSSNNLLFGGNQIIQTTGTITASRVLASDGSGNIASSSVTSTTLAFLDATSSVQTQLNTKISALTGDVAASGGGSAAATIQANVVSNSKLAQMATLTIKGNNTGGTANPLDLTVAQVKTLTNTAPTVQKFLSSSGTYTTPANVLYLKVTMVGGGGGGGGSGTAGAGAGGTGGNTTFGTTLLVANGGVGGNVTAGGAGGTASLGSGPVGIALSGSAGHGIPGVPNSSTFGGAGGAGGVSPLGGAGVPVYSAAGAAAVANSGSGGAGGGVGNTLSDVPGGGGGAGGYVSAIITSPLATYAYAVGAAGTAGTAGTSGFVGGAGALGVIVVEEFYQ